VFFGILLTPYGAVTIYKILVFKIGFFIGGTGKPLWETVVRRINLRHACWFINRRNFCKKSI